MSEESRSEGSHGEECREGRHEECGGLAVERMRYFTGRYLTARDFRDEQDYHLTHRYLHNRVMHGWGVVCGLQVYEHPNPACRGDRVKVNAGMAVDCCGREIVVNRPLVPPPIPWREKYAGGADAAQTPPRGDYEQRDEQGQRADYDQRGDREQRGDYDDRRGRDGREDEREDRRWYPLLCLRYVETPIERVPVLYSESNCDEQRREHSRVAEGYAFEWQWVQRSDLPKYHWKIPGGRCPDRRDDDHDGREHEHGAEQQQQQQQQQQGQQYQQQEPPLYQWQEGAEARADDERRPARDGEDEGDRRYPCPEDDCYSHPDDRPSVGCLEPDCPPHHCVPVALVLTRPGRPVRSDDIDMLGRPTLRPPTQSLTHICSINWPHGGVIPRRRLERLRRLEVRFDRRLKRTRSEPGECSPYGVNPCTFVVQYGGGYEDLDFVTYDEPPAVEHDCVAVFSLDPRSRKHQYNRPYSYLENQTIFVTLKCDFILDCHGVPVDGNHLAGLLPSGDGIRGGTFESWFRVVPDHEWERYERAERSRDEEQAI